MIRRCKSGKFIQDLAVDIQIQSEFQFSRQGEDPFSITSTLWQHCPNGLCMLLSNSITVCGLGY